MKTRTYDGRWIRSHRKTGITDDLTWSPSNRFDPITTWRAHRCVLIRAERAMRTVFDSHVNVGGDKRYRWTCVENDYHRVVKIRDTNRKVEKSSRDVRLPSRTPKHIFITVGFYLVFEFIRSVQSLMSDYKLPANNHY